jgi:transcriptional regulator of heat shock response
MSSGRRNFTKRRVRKVYLIALGASNALKIRFLQRYQIRNRNVNLAHQNSLYAWAEIEFILDLGFGEVVE